MIRAAKPLVIAGFSVLWLVVSIMRVPDGIGKSADIGIDTSWVLALPATLHQHSISGRDMHFTYGPLSQLLAYAGASFHSPWSVIDSLPLILLAFYSASVVLFAAILLLLDSIGWKKCIFICSAAAGLNLFSEPTAFRPLALMLCAVLFYRALRSPSLPAKVGWAATAGAACFAAQLLTFELGPYAVAMAVFTAGVFALRKDKGTRSLECLGGLLAVYIAANLNLDLLFSLFSRQYDFFDYQRYAFEMIRGFTFSQSLPWELAPVPSLGLALAGLFGIGSAVYICLKSDRSEAVLFCSLLICSLIELKSVTVRSDLGHITQSSSPMVFLILLSGALLLSRWRTSKAPILMWAGAFATLWFSWPWSGPYFASDLRRTVTQQSPFDRLAHLRVAESDPLDVLPERLAGEAGESTGPMLAFPYQNYIPIALRRRIVAPILMSYNASTAALQQFYVEKLERENNLEVVYGLDNAGSSAIDNVQTITRVPLIFDYLYAGFRSNPNSPAGAGFYLLHRDKTSPRGFDDTEVLTNTMPADDEAIEIRPKAATACNLLRLSVELDYPFWRYFGRPTPLELVFFSEGAPFLKTVLTAIDSNTPFSTYVSLIPAEHFHEIFGANPISPTSWDRLQVAPRQSDWLGVSPSRIDIRKIDCLVTRPGT